MGKKKSKSKKEIICDICKTRTGGQIALAGFTYQFLYSCFLILSEMDEKTIFVLEGVEDIDKVYVENSIENSKHIQLKYSIQKQDASFMKDILKNFLEVYLIDKDRGFKLVYDFQVAKGNLDKLLRGKLDDKSNEYWKQKVNEIKKENPAWNWENFSFEHFISKLSFEKIRKIDLAKQIEGLLIKRYDILTDNLSLYANGLKVCCFEKMTRGDSVNKNELDELILEIKTDISKGNHNPAYKWIKKVDFDIEKNYEENFDYYEGKKPSYQDIAMKLPVDREIIEKEIKDSIIKNRITVIKASSGQGKTTLAFKTAYELRNEYTIYQLLWCKDSKELDNIVSYIKSRVKMGEKPLIILDNLDSDFVEWNKLVQILQNKILINYKMIITTREDDWYNYGGDLSNIKSLKVIKPILSEDEAKEIYTKLRKQGNLHFSIRDWRKEFRKVEKKKLLIEYIYLLTHGEMLSERISNQIREISKSESGKIKCEILRKICFADMCGIQISVKKLIKNLKESSFQDYGEILKSLENEYLVKIDGTEKYIEGLHPVRSQHIVCQLHEFIDLEDTILELVNIIDLRYFAKLFFYLPKYVKNKQEFYQELVGKIFNKNDLRCCIDVLRGVFSGVIMEYYIANKAAYDEANSRGGLELYSMELNPFIKFKQENLSVGVLDELREAMPDMRNIDYLCRLRDKTPKIELSQSDIYILCKSIYGILKKYEVFTDITDIISYQKIMYWLINVNSTFNLTDKISLDILWKNREKYLVETISNIMYIYFYENRIEYDKFVTENMEMILIYLRNITKSMRIYTDLENKKVYVEYILMPSEIDKGNKESVLRLNIVCKMLPFFDVYCAKSIKPKIDIFSEYEIPDDSYKTIPRRNLIIGFHKEFISLWNNTVLSNYEFDSIYGWIEFWLNVREDIVEYLKKSNSFLCKKLGKKNIVGIANEIDKLSFKIRKNLLEEHRYPHQDKPFEEKIKEFEEFSQLKNGFFADVFKIMNQFPGFITKSEKFTKLFLLNLQSATSKLKDMHIFFSKICTLVGVLIEKNSELCEKEDKIYPQILITCMYYLEHEPIDYFNDNIIESWYIQKNKSNIEYMIDRLNNLVKEYSVTFPKKDIFNDGLTFFPIIINNFDIYDSEEILKLLFCCRNFFDSKYDYLILLFCNKSNFLKHYGVKINRDFFEKFSVDNKLEDNNKKERLGMISYEETTKEIIDCFQSKYDIEEELITGYENASLVSEILWKFSKAKKILKDKKDSDYLTEIEKECKTKIKTLLEELKLKIQSEDFKKIQDICSNAMTKGNFLDEDFNKFDDWIRHISLEKLRHLEKFNY